VSSPPPRWLIGNLDFEETLVGGARPALSLKVRRGLAALATLMRVLGGGADRLWTPHAVDPRRLPPIPGVPPVRLESAPLDPAATRACAVLAWGETEAVARLRESAAASGGGRTPAGGAASTGVPLHERVWRGPYASAASARRVNHRGFGAAVAERLGLALPGVRLLSSLGELEAHLRAGGASPAGDRWVLKGGYSAAGRDRLRGAGRELPSGAPLARARRLLARHDALLFEPWFAREIDVGCAAWVAADEVRLLGLHRLEVDGYGRFRALTVTRTDPASARGLREVELDALVSTVQSVGKALRASGYLGPFGLDAWRYRDARGTIRFHPLGEINARLTIGLLVHALAGRLEEAGIPGNTLRFGLGREPDPRRPPPTGGRRIGLLESGPGDPTTAWLDVW